MNTRHLLLTLCIIAAAAFAKAGVLKPNAVYRFTNYSTGSCMTVNNAGNGAQVLAKNENDRKQLWYVTENQAGTGYYLRNVSTGGYLCSSRATSAQWPVKNTSQIDDEVMLITFLADNTKNPGAGTLYNFKALTHTGTYVYAHHQANGNMLVCWMNSDPSFWHIDEVPMTQSELDDILSRFENLTDEIAKNDVYQGHLQALFADNACTRLRDGIGDIESNEHFTALPVGLKNMVRKVASGDWAETNGQWVSDHSAESWDENTDNWNDKYARKYRVQYYEPYSEGSTAASMAGIQAYTNMNNPTGVIGDADRLLYVMVEDPVPDGATLYIGGCPDDQMYNTVTAGTALHQGLNTILCSNNNTHFYIYYTVNTVSSQTQNGRSRYLPVQGRELSRYKPIKIHIEGGRLNGFFNYIGDDASILSADPDFSYTPDQDADYRYTVARASHIMYDLLGKYIILHLHLNDTPSKPNTTPLYKGVRSSLDRDGNPGTDYHYDPAEILPYWDNMCFSERILMGIQSDADIADPVNNDMYTTIVNDVSPVSEYITDPGFHYSDYFNNRMMGISQQGDLFMNATSWRSAYNVSTISAILNLFPEGNIWGPAHEYGHINQPPMNIAGTTEVSNNIFSNVATYYAPKGTTSRCDYPEKQLEHFLNGDTYLLNQTWGTTRMYWQLWIYYHATKHNTKFYPRLYELLRRYPISKTTVSSGTHNPKNDMLHFAKMCCVAAGEDLTNFFTAWGFFFPFEMDIDDYSQYHAVLTQEDIDAVKAEIKSYGFEVNNAIITIDDRVDNPRKSHSEFDKTKCGDLGGLQAYLDNAVPSGDYGYKVDGNTVTVSKGDNAQEGVGFLIFDEDGNLVAFSNSYSFDVTPEIAAALQDGTLTVQAVWADNTTAVDVVNTAREGSVAEKIEMLQQISQKFSQITAMVDPSRTKVGYYYPEACADLISRNEDVARMLKELETNSNAYTSESLTETYFDMVSALQDFQNDKTAKIPVMDGCTYMMLNKQYPTHLLTFSTTTDASGTKTNCASGTKTEGVVPTYGQQWILEKVPDADGMYYIRNVDTGLYIGYTPQNSTTIPMTVNPEQTYSLVEKSQGLFALAMNGNTSTCIHHASGGSIVRWSDTDPSQWTITMIKDKEFMDARAELDRLIQQAAKRLEKAGTVTPTPPYTVDFKSHESEMVLNTTESLIYTNNLPINPDYDKYTFTSWNCLFDNDPATYFFSRHDGTGTVDKTYPYLRFKAPGENETFTHVKFSYTTTTKTNLVNDSKDKNPKQFIIEASSNGTTWSTVFTENAAPTGQGIIYTTPEFNVPKGTKYLRFAVIKNQGGYYYTRDNVVQHVLVVGDVNIFNRTDDVICQPYNSYPHVAPEDMSKVYNALMDARAKYAAPASTTDDLITHLDITDSENQDNACSLAYHNFILAMRMIETLNVYVRRDINGVIGDAMELQLADDGKPVITDDREFVFVRKYDTFSGSFKISDCNEDPEVKEDCFNYGSSKGNDNVLTYEKLKLSGQDDAPNINMGEETLYNVTISFYYNPDEEKPSYVKVEATPEYVNLRGEYNGWDEDTSIQLLPIAQLGAGKTSYVYHTKQSLSGQSFKIGYHGWLFNYGVGSGDYHEAPINTTYPAVADNGNFTTEPVADKGELDILFYYNPEGESYLLLADMPEEVKVVYYRPKQEPKDNVSTFAIDGEAEVSPEVSQTLTRVSGPDENGNFTYEGRNEALYGHFRIEDAQKSIVDHGAENEEVTLGKDLNAVRGSTTMFNVPDPIVLKGGVMTFVVNPNNNIPEGTFQLSNDATVDVRDIVVGNDGNVEYFNMQGMKVTNPERGVYIRVTGEKVDKVLQ